MKITQETRDALLAFWNNKSITSCWGIHNIKIASDTITFDVEGLIYSSPISVECTYPNNYTIKFNNNITIPCTLESLVDLIDTQIEHSTDYIADVAEWIVDTLEKVDNEPKNPLTF